MATAQMSSVGSSSLLLAAVPTGTASAPSTVSVERAVQSHFEPSTPPTLVPLVGMLVYDVRKQIQAAHQHLETPEGIENARKILSDVGRHLGLPVSYVPFPSPAAVQPDTKILPFDKTGVDRDQTSNRDELRRGWELIGQNNEEAKIIFSKITTIPSLDWMGSLMQTWAYVGITSTFPSDSLDRLESAAKAMEAIKTLYRSSTLWGHNAKEEATIQFYEEFMECCKALRALIPSRRQAMHQELTAIINDCDSRINPPQRKVTVGPVDDSSGRIFTLVLACILLGALFYVGRRATIHA